MRASKRKFNALLQGLSNPPAPPAGMAEDASSADFDALLQKRRRLGLPDLTAPRPYRPWPGSKPRAGARSSGAAAHAGSSQTAPLDSPAKYCPGDRDQLLKRLSTFQDITRWTPKPDSISEIQWAKRGWVCRVKETLRCLLCQRELLLQRQEDNWRGQLQDSIDSSSDDAGSVQADDAHNLIIAAHQQDCLWRIRGCDDSLLRLSFSNAKAVLSALRRRYDELCTRAAFLPLEANVRLPDALDLDTMTSLLPDDFLTGSSPDQSSGGSLNRVALALALIGWQGLSDSRLGPVTNSASCHSCLRRLGLWMFSAGDQGEKPTSPPMDHLDPLREHRFYCPWKSAQAQSSARALPGAESEATPAWQVLLQTIRNESELRSVYEGRPTAASTASAILTEAALPSPAASTPADGETGGPPSGFYARNEVRSPDLGSEFSSSAATGDEEKARQVKDKQRWARLRKVKSLFDTKGARKLMHPLSRPGTSSSNKSSAV